MIVSCMLNHTSHKLFSYFFFNDTATTEIYTLSLHDALPISACGSRPRAASARPTRCWTSGAANPRSSSAWVARSEEHTSELQSRLHLVCRLLLEKKKAILPTVVHSPHRPVIESATRL